MIKKEMLYTLRDITIIPNEISRISSRQECNPFRKKIEGDNDFYPIIAAPMASVVNDSNYLEFWKNKINCIIPRNISLHKRLELCTSVFCAFGILEITDNFIIKQKDLGEQKLFVLIDIANGHLRKELEIGKKLKELYGEKIVLMGGNIANPETYKTYNSAGFDFLRVGIGGGAGCTTSTQTGIHYPMASLISDTFEIKEKTPFSVTKIIADGGIFSYSDAIKCLSLGADYVMMGKTFAKSLESCGEIYEKCSVPDLSLGATGFNDTLRKIDLSDIDGEIIIPKPDSKGYHGWYRNYYGMSTKKAQAEILGEQLEEAKNKGLLKTAEGRSELLLIEYTLPGWIDNMNSYLRSAMSYCDSQTLEKFKNLSHCQVMSTTTSEDINEK